MKKQIATQMKGPKPDGNEKEDEYVFVDEKTES